MAIAKKCKNLTGAPFRLTLSEPLAFKRAGGRRLFDTVWLLLHSFMQPTNSCNLNGCFGISDDYRPVPELDHWIRRRVRMRYWKQWRYARTKVRNLLAPGTGKRHAILTAISSKSDWHLSKTLATQTSMAKRSLKDQGLIGVRE